MVQALAHLIRVIQEWWDLNLLKSSTQTLWDTTSQSSMCLTPFGLDALREVSYSFVEPTCTSDWDLKTEPGLKETVTTLVWVMTEFARDQERNSSYNSLPSWCCELTQDGTVSSATKTATHNYNFNFKKRFPNLLQTCRFNMDRGGISPN